MDGDDDPERLARITAHLVARIGDRFHFLRKVSRHLEGAENRAGLLSDLLAALTVLYRRNPDAMQDAAQKLAQEIRSQRVQRMQREQGTPDGPLHAVPPQYQPNH